MLRSTGVLSPDAFFLFLNCSTNINIKNLSHAGELPPLVIDTHAHLTDESLLPQLESLLAEAQAADVRAILAVATNLATSQGCLDLAQRYTCIRASVGITAAY
mgnify:CR=1 FL=1